jgi:aspartate aminotransferase
MRTDGATTSAQLAALRGALTTFEAFLNESEWTRRAGDPSIADFVVGNPHDPPIAAYVDALLAATTPRRTDWYAYKMNERSSVRTVAASLRERFGMPFEPEDVFMTNGNFGGLAIALRTVVDPGDEVVFISPPWFFYEALILASGATPVRVLADREAFDLDLEAIERAITGRTRAIIVNTPHNPSGRIYPVDQLDGLADVLAAAEQRFGQPIFLLSDEAYNRIVFDDLEYPTPVAYYPRSFLLYTYAKTLLTPGSRLGYIALPPTMPRREELRDTIPIAQILTGWAFPVAQLQHALPELEPMSVDVAHLQSRRDRICAALRSQGYELVMPQGTFYILVRSPLEDDLAFVELLNARDVFVLPGSVFEMPGWFRISITASDDMIERGVGGFARARQDALAGEAQAG